MWWFLNSETDRFLEILNCQGRNELSLERVSIAWICTETNYSISFAWVFYTVKSLVGVRTSCIMWGFTSISMGEYKSNGSAELQNHLNAEKVENGRETEGWDILSTVVMANWERVLAKYHHLSYEDSFHYISQDKGGYPRNMLGIERKLGLFYE